MGRLTEIEKKAKEGGYKALKLFDRMIAFEHGWLKGWCDSCGRPLTATQKRHFKPSWPRRACLGRVTFENPNP